jgi:NADPH:quinone reductase-like Zn-dependent oxidoreductase
VHVARAFPLERGAEAHRSIEAGGTTGKLVLTVAD